MIIVRTLIEDAGCKIMEEIASCLTEREVWCFRYRAHLPKVTLNNTTGMHFEKDLPKL